MDPKIDTVKKFISDNSTTILTVTAITGVTATTAFAINGTYHAVKRINKTYNIKCPEDRKELIRILAKCYWKMILCGGITIASIIAIKSEGDKRLAATTAAYKLASDTVEKMKDYIRDNNGVVSPEEVEKEVIHKQAREAYTRAMIPDGPGDLFYDAQTGQIFRSSKDEIHAAQNTINAKYIGEVHNGMVCAAEAVELNEFLSLIGEQTVELGDIELGWEPGIWTKPTPMLGVNIDYIEIDGQLMYCLRYNVHNISKEYY